MDTTSEEMRERDEIEQQHEDAEALRQYHWYWDGVAADEYGKQFVEYDEGIEHAEVRYAEEEEYTNWQYSHGDWESYCFENADTPFELLWRLAQ